MKIAIVLGSLNVMGGTQREALMLARELKKTGHEVKIYACKYSGKGYADLLAGFDVVSLPVVAAAGGVFSSLIKKKILPQQLNSLSKLAQEIMRANRDAKHLAGLIDTDTDVINPHGSYAHKVSYYFKRLKPAPSVWMLTTITSHRWLNWRWRELSGTKNISRKGELLCRLLDRYEKKFVDAHDSIVVLDNINRKDAKKYFNREAVVVRSGLSIERHSFQPRAFLTGKPVSILLMGIFAPQRRFEDAITALKSLLDKGYDAKITVIGKHDQAGAGRHYAKKLFALVSSMDLEKKVNFLGRVSEEDLQKIYKESDIAIFPNILQTWGLAVFEAMACGMPVVVSKSMGAHELLSDKETAMLVNPKSPHEISAAVAHLIDRPDIYAKLSSAGREFVENNVSWERYTKDMLKVYSNALNAKLS